MNKIRINRNEDDGENEKGRKSGIKKKTPLRLKTRRKICFLLFQVVFRIHYEVVFGIENIVCTRFFATEYRCIHRRTHTHTPSAWSTLPIHQANVNEQNTFT